MESEHSKKGYLFQARELARLMYELAVEKADGILTISSGASRRWLAGLGRGNLLSLDLPPGANERLGTILMKRGLIDGPDLEASLEKARTDKVPHGQVLVSWGLERPRLWSALREQSKHRFDRFLAEARGLFSFRAGRPDDGQSRLGAPLDIVEELRQQLDGSLTPTDRRALLEKLGRVPFRVRPELLPPAWLLSPEEIEWLRRFQNRSTLKILPADVERRRRLAAFMSFMETVGAIEMANPEQPNDQPFRSPAAQSPLRKNRVIGEGGSSATLFRRSLENRPDAGQVGSSVEELKRWWRKTARKFHPDANPHMEPERKRYLTEQFMELRRTYENRLARLKTSSHE